MKRSVALLVAFVLFSFIASCGDDDDDTSVDGTDVPEDGSDDGSNDGDAGSNDGDDGTEGQDDAGGSDAQDSDGSPDTDESEDSAEQEPIRVMAIGLFEAPNFAYPEARSAAEAHVELINESGGIQGRPIELLTCNDQFDPNEAANCAREAVENDVVAVLAAYSLSAPNIIPILEEAGIPWVGNRPTSGPEYQSEVSMPVEGGNISTYLLVGRALRDAGCERASAVTLDIAPNELTAELVRFSFEHAGGDFVNNVLVSADVPDLAPSLASALAGDVDCVVPLIATADAVKLVRALGSNPDNVRIVSSAAVLSAPLVEELGESAEGIVATDAKVTTSAEVPGAEEFREGMASYAPDAALTPQALSGWLTVSLLQSLIETIDGSVTAASVFAAWEQAEGIDLGGMIPEINVPAATPIPGYERIVNHGGFIYRVEEGSYVPLSDGPVPTADVLSAFIAETG